MNINIRMTIDVPIKHLPSLERALTGAHLRITPQKNGGWALHHSSMSGPGSAVPAEIIATSSNAPADRD